MCDIQALKSHFLCEVWWRGVPTGRPLGGAAAVKWCTVRPPADSLGLSAALSGKLQNCCCCFFFLVRMVPGLSLLVVLASACSAFNLDTENVVRKTSGDPNSLFGFSMTMHRQLQPEDKTL